MGEILLITLYSLVLAAPISLLAGILYVFLSLLCQHILGLSEVRGGMFNFIVINMAVFCATLTFLVLFAYFCRSF